MFLVVKEFFTNVMGNDLKRMVPAPTGCKMPKTVEFCSRYLQRCNLGKIARLGLRDASAVAYAA